MNEKIRLPFPDPMGILERLTQGLPVQLFDPAVSSGESKNESKSKDYVDNIDKYKYHLLEAYKVAPCDGCKNLVEGSLVGLEIYKYMINNNKSRDDVSGVVIEKIKNEVKQKYLL